MYLTPPVFASLLAAGTLSKLAFLEVFEKGKINKQLTCELSDHTASELQM